MGVPLAGTRHIKRIVSGTGNLSSLSPLSLWALSSVNLLTPLYSSNRKEKNSSEKDPLFELSSCKKRRRESSMEMRSSLLFLLLTLFSTLGFNAKASPTGDFNKSQNLFFLFHVLGFSLSWIKE